VPEVGEQRGVADGLGDRPGALVVVVVAGLVVGVLPQHGRDVAADDRPAVGQEDARLGEAAGAAVDADDGEVLVVLLEQQQRRSVPSPVRSRRRSARLSRSSTSSRSSSTPVQPCSDLASAAAK
jgi:hypothetical protein